MIADILLWLMLSMSVYAILLLIDCLPAPEPECWDFTPLHYDPADTNLADLEAFQSEIFRNAGQPGMVIMAPRPIAYGQYLEYGAAPRLTGYLTKTSKYYGGARGGGKKDPLVQAVLDGRVSINEALAEAGVDLVPAGFITGAGCRCGPPTGVFTPVKSPRSIDAEGNWICPTL
jgi:hypothetical protein